MKDIFLPVTLGGRLFRRYLTMRKHPAKVRMQNIAGNLFSKGISLKNEQQVRFTLDANDWITRMMLLDGNYENGSTLLAKRILSAGGLFIDAGANFGLFTCIVAAANENVKVLAIEPNHKVLHRLLHNIRQNRLESQVQVINVALSAGFKFVTLEQQASNNLGTTSTKEGLSGLLSVLGCPLDFICRENNSSSITLLKMDIEGNELDILNHFPFADFQIKNIILEFNHLSKVPLKEQLSFFESKGFAAFTITGEVLTGDTGNIPENNIWLVNQL